MDIINKHIGNASECICVWLKELESCGFATFFVNSDILDKKTKQNKNKTNLTEENSADDFFTVEDPFGEIDNNNDIEKIIYEDGQDENSGFTGHCTVVLHDGYELR